MTVRQIIPVHEYIPNMSYTVFPPLKRELEFALEVVRREAYNYLPSRLYGTFVIPDHDLYEALWRPKLHLENMYTVLVHEVNEPMIWFNAYILDDVRGNNLSEISHAYWRSARDSYDIQDQSFLSEGICTRDMIISEVLYKE